MILSRLHKLNFNFLSTIYLNFKAFKLKDAFKLPVVCYGRICFEDVHKGCIELAEVKPRTLKLGGGKYTFIFGKSDLDKSYYRFSGTLSVGSNVIIDQGCIISICKGARLDLGSNIYMNRRSVIHVKKSVIIGDNTRIGWNCQILDSNFHYTINDSGLIGNRTKPVRIGHNVWLANNVHVCKGTILPNYSVVGSMSLVNKDLTSWGEKCLFGGVPAKMLLKGVRRLLDVENELDGFFVDDEDSISIDSIPSIKGI